MKDQRTRRLAAIMFTDIEGYTALMQQDEKVAAKVRDHHREKFQHYHEVYHGEILQYYGDGTLSIFQSGVEAVECAVAIQRALREGQSVPLRIGLHMGDIVFDGTEIYGDGVNFTSRIESMGIAGAILLSGKLNDELKNHPQLSTKSLGRFELKNIKEPVEVFAVTNEGITIPQRSELKGEQQETRSIAVLPFVNMSSNEDNEYFSDGMTEEIINALAKIKNLRVTSRTSVFYFKNRNIPIQQIGKELNVSTILEGSIRLSGNKVRITAQLIDVTNDFHFWSETFDRSMEDIFAVQDEISLLIADKLREHIGHFEVEDHLVDSPGIPVDVYKKYLLGRFHLMKLDLQGTMKGIAIFEEVIAEQPDFALAYLSINQGYAYLGTMGLIPAAEGFIKGKPFLDKAIELEADLPESQLNLAWISCWQDWDLESAYRHLNKALEIRQTDELYLTMSNLLTVEGNLKAAQNYADKALQLDPFSAMNHHYKGFLFYLEEKYEVAVPYFERALDLKPELIFPPLYLGAMLVLKGEAATALDFFRSLPPDKPGSLTKQGGLVLAYAALGDIAPTEAGLKQLESLLQTEAMDSALHFLILVKTVIGKYDEAIELLEQGVNYRLPRTLLLHTEPLVKPLRSNPRFQELMRQILGKKATSFVADRKYRKALFSAKELERYQHQLAQLMVNEKPYLDPGLTLRDLASMLEIPANQLSQLLNEGFNKNFSEYINAYRVESFKSKVADSDKRHLTLLAIAYESGFNSKTVFNTFFRKMTGKTPKAYWKEVVEK